LLPLFALTLAGCGGNVLPPETDPEEGKKLLTTTLDAWVQGKSPTDLKPMVVVDEDWAEGHKLAKYTIDPDHQRAGVDLVLKVKLSLQKKEGRAEVKSVMYVVGVTATQTAVMRYNP
jgi:hypothetical protein